MLTSLALGQRRHSPSTLSEMSSTICAAANVRHSRVSSPIARERYLMPTEVERPRSSFRHRETPKADASFPATAIATRALAKAATPPTTGREGLDWPFELLLAQFDRWITRAR